MRILSIIVAVAVLIVLANTIYVVNEYEQVIKTQFGKPVGEPVTAAGLHAKAPFIQKVWRFDKRFLEWNGDANELPTRDKRFVFVDTYARWRITDPLLYFQRLRDERGAQTRLDDILDGETRNAIANAELREVIRSTNRQPLESDLDVEEQTTLEDIEIGRSRLQEIILEAAKSRTDDLGIEILDVRFKRINYIEDVQRTVYERMISERKRIADRFRSEGQGEAQRIRGELDRDLKEIESDAYRQAQTIIGEADAEATRIFAQAYDRSPQTRGFYQFLKTMETFETTIDAKTSLILSTNGDFMKFLTGSAGQ